MVVVEVILPIDVFTRQCFFLTTAWYNQYGRSVIKVNVDVNKQYNRHFRSCLLLMQRKSCGWITWDCLDPRITFGSHPIEPLALQGIDEQITSTKDISFTRLYARCVASGTIMRSAHFFYFFFLLWAATDATISDLSSRPFALILTVPVEYRSYFITTNDRKTVSSSPPKGEIKN